jgi:hypothetical protein
MPFRPSVSAFVTVVDGKGAESTTRWHQPDTSEIATMKTFIQNTASLIDAIIKGKITNLSIGLGVDLPGGLKSAPDANSDVEEIGQFLFASDGGGTVRLSLPTIDEAKVLAGTAVIDTADTDVADFVTQIVDGQTITLQAQHPSAIDGSDITALDSATARFGKNRG